MKFVVKKLPIAEQDTLQAALWYLNSAIALLFWGVLFWGDHRTKTLEHFQNGQAEIHTIPDICGVFSLNGDIIR
jgi:hypothetical protein